MIPIYLVLIVMEINSDVEIDIRVEGEIIYEIIPSFDSSKIHIRMDR